MIESALLCTIKFLTTHSATRRSDDVVMMSFCTSQQHRSYVLNETFNDISVERIVDVSIICLHNVLLECHHNVSRERNIDITLVSLQDVSSKSRMKHQITSQFSVVRHQDASFVHIHDVLLIRLYSVSCNSQMKLPITLLC